MTTPQVEAEAEADASRRLRQRGARALADLCLREKLFLAAFRRQAAALGRQGENADTLAAHLGRAGRRSENLLGWIAASGGPPPAFISALFRFSGGVTGRLTSIGGGRRTLRAALVSTGALAGCYSRFLSQPLEPETAYRLAGNYRDVLILAKWLGDRLDFTSPRRADPVTIGRVRPTGDGRGSAGAGHATTAPSGPDESPG